MMRSWPFVFREQFGPRPMKIFGVGDCGWGILWAIVDFGRVARLPRFTGFSPVIVGYLETVWLVGRKSFL